VSNAFNTQPRAQEEWSWLLATWLFLGGSGSGLFLLSQILQLPAQFAALAWLLVLLGATTLLLELGNPLRAWRTIFRPATSWLSRGVFFVFFFIVSGFFFVGPTFGVPWLSWLSGSLLASILGWVAGVCALMIILYPGFFFLSTSRAIPFWNTPLLPLLFVSYAALGGTAVVLVASPYLALAVPAQIDWLALALTAITAVMIAIYLLIMHRAGHSAGESVRLLHRAPLGWIFWIGVVGAGLLLPLLVLAFAPAAAALAGAGILIGSLLFRYCVLKAGVYVAPALVVMAPDLSRLNRTSSDFAREYAAMAAQSASRPR
jgi:formate-dependent nitrite reductase membrane component NrfD